MRRFRISIQKPGEEKQVFIERVQDSARDFRITFNCSNSYTYCLGLLDLAIYNLADKTQVPQFAKLTLEAGYDNDLAAIFSGTIMSVLKEREGANTRTRILCRSGERPDDRGNEVRPMVNATLGRNSSTIDAINLVASAWGKSVDIQEDQFSDVPLIAMKSTLSGDVVRILSDLAEQHNFQWFNSGEEIIIDRTKKKREGVPRELSISTGLIGIPEMADENVGVFVNMTSRLLPSLRLGDLIELKSKYASYSTGNMYYIPPVHGGDLNGIYKVMEIVHEGDSWGDQWRTQIKGMRNG